RVAAAIELGRVGTPAATELLVVLLQRDVDPRVRAAAAVQLGTSGNGDLVEKLDFAAHADWDPAARAAATTSSRAVAPFARRPRMAAGLSVLCPGCGYFYLGEPRRALAFLGSAAALIVAGIEVGDHSPAPPPGVDAGGRAI